MNIGTPYTAAPISASPDRRARLRIRGFTLIEVMIVVAIIGILAAIAYPSYKQHIISSNRASAEAALEGLANAMEQHYTETGTYTGAANASGVPTIYATQAPVDGTPKVYNLTISATATTYTLTATPISGTTQAGDGFLQLTNTGVKSWDADNSGAIGSGENTW